MFDLVKLFVVCNLDLASMFRDDALHELWNVGIEKEVTHLLVAYVQL